MRSFRFSSSKYEITKIMNSRENFSWFYESVDNFGQCNREALLGIRTVNARFVYLSVPRNIDVHFGIGNWGFRCRQLGHYSCNCIWIEVNVCRVLFVKLNTRQVDGFRSVEGLRYNNAFRRWNYSSIIIVTEFITVAYTMITAMLESKFIYIRVRRNCK